MSLIRPPPLHHIGMIFEMYLKVSLNRYSPSANTVTFPTQNEIAQPVAMNFFIAEIDVSGCCIFHLTTREAQVLRSRIARTRLGS